MGNSIYLCGGLKSAYCGGNVKEIWQGSNKIFGGGGSSIWDGETLSQDWRTSGHIKTASEFADFLSSNFSNADLDVILDVDVDMANIPFETNSNTRYNKTFNGNFKTIKNLSCTLKEKSLFGTSNGVKNITLKDSLINSNSVDGWFMYKRASHFYRNICLNNINVVTKNTSGYNGSLISGGWSNIGYNCPVENFLILDCSFSISSKTIYFMFNNTDYTTQSYCGRNILIKNTSVPDKNFQGVAGYSTGSSGIERTTEKTNLFRTDNLSNFGTLETFENAILTMNQYVREQARGDLSLIDENGNFTGICP